MASAATASVVAQKAFRSNARRSMGSPVSPSRRSSVAQANSEDTHISPSNKVFWAELKSSASSPDFVKEAQDKKQEKEKKKKEAKKKRLSRSISDATTGPVPPPKLLSQLWFTTKTSVFHPSNPIKLKWDLFVGLVVIFSVVIVPWKVGFNIPSTNAWILVDFLADTVFLLDMCLTFNTGFYEDLAEEILVLDRTRVAMEYIRTWFLIDLLSTLPFDYLVSAITTGTLTNIEGNGIELRLTKLARGLRLFRLAKLITMTVKVQRLHKAANHHMDINPAVLPLFKMICFIFYALHVLGCGWYFICTLDENAIRENWIGKVDSIINKKGT